MRRTAGPALAIFEAISVAVFALEYAGRLWACVEAPRFARPVAGRLRFASRFMPLVDLLAFLPSLLFFLGLDLRFIRALRLMRVARVVKGARYSASLSLIVRVLREKKEELVMTTALMAMLLILSSCLMFYCENAAQPESFTSIPATMWWSVATLTTVGYGDVYPVTALGRFLASAIAILGIGMFALPTAILGSGFVEEIGKSKEARHTCPHCGRRVGD